jgi:hypothetical protein
MRVAYLPGTAAPRRVRAGVRFFSTAYRIQEKGMGREMRLAAVRL